MGTRKFIQVVPVHQNPLACIFLSVFLLMGRSWTLLTHLSDVVQRRMGPHWKFIQVVAVHQNPSACIFYRFGEFLRVFLHFCVFWQVFTRFCVFLGLGALLGALGTLLG